jgi:hypothetical protein
MYVCNRECLCLCRRSDSTKRGRACSPNLKLHDDDDDDDDTEHPSSLLLLVRENAAPACRKLWSRFFCGRGEEAKRTTFKTNSEWESKSTPITEGEFWAERAANTPEQNGQVGLVTTPFAVDAYETRPRVRPPHVSCLVTLLLLPYKGPLSGGDRPWRFRFLAPVKVWWLPACLPCLPALPCLALRVKGFRKRSLDQS